MGRKPCCDMDGLKRGPWTAEEDSRLINFMLTHGQCCWKAVPKLAGLPRCGKSCRLRWTNYLRPDLKRGLLSECEEKLVIELHSQLGNRWSKIAAQLPGRTDNEIKNLWNTHIKKKLRKMGIDPVTHMPISQEAAPEENHEAITEAAPVAVHNASSNRERQAEYSADPFDCYYYNFCTDDVPIVHPAEIGTVLPATHACSASLPASSTSTPCSSAPPSSSEGLAGLPDMDYSLESEFGFSSPDIWGANTMNGSLVVDSALFHSSLGSSMYW